MFSTMISKDVRRRNALDCMYCTPGHKCPVCSSEYQEGAIKAKADEHAATHEPSTVSENFSLLFSPLLFLPDKAEKGLETNHLGSCC